MASLKCTRGIQLHTYGPQLYPTKKASFDGALGPLYNLLDASGGAS